jgi:hypothetical protein
MHSTLDRVRAELVSDTLVRRYDVGKAARDGLPGGAGTFSVCTFWLAEAMARSGQVEAAPFVFEKMLTYANHLGLFAEQIGSSGESLGNFPGVHTPGTDQFGLRAEPGVGRGLSCPAGGGARASRIQAVEKDELPRVPPGISSAMPLPLS